MITKGTALSKILSVFFFPLPYDVETKRTLYLRKLNIQLHSRSLKEYGQKPLLNHSAEGEKKSRMIPENMPYAQQTVIYTCQ